MSKPNYWRDMYGQRSKDFIEGVIAGVKGFAIWKEGKQVVGVLEIPLEKEIEEIKNSLGWWEDEDSMEERMAKEKSTQVAVIHEPIDWNEVYQDEGPDLTEEGDK